MDQSDIEQLTAIFAKLGYNVSITKRNHEDETIVPKKPKKEEPIVPKKPKKEEINGDEKFKCVPIYMPVPIKDNKCLCRLDKKGIPTQCSGNRLDGTNVCTRHNKKMSNYGMYDDDKPPECTSDGKKIFWKFETKKVAVETNETTVLTAVKPKKEEDIAIKDMFGTDSDEEEEKIPPVKKMTNSKHEELMKSLEEITSDESPDSDDDEADEYTKYKKSGEKDDLIIEFKIIDGVKYTYRFTTDPIVWGFVMYNEEQENVGTWNKDLGKMEWKSDKFRDEHIYHTDYNISDPN